MIQSQLQALFSDSSTFQRLKEEGVEFDKRMITRMFLNAPKVDERDAEDPLDSEWWIVNAECLADNADVIIEWVRKNAEGPLWALYRVND